MAFSASAQRNAWKRQRYDVFAGSGITSFMGDLGGGKNTSGVRWLTDLDLAASRPLIAVGGRYKVLETLVVGAGIYFGYVRGDDKWSKDIFRLERNLNFRSPIIEFSPRVEYHVIPEKLGRKTRRKRRGASLWQTIQSFPLNTYVFAGVGLYWFNPQGRDADGNWHNLHRIGTEGQYVLDTRKPYKRVQLSIPFGVGVRYALDKRFSIGLEYGPRWTFTDYIDDVSMNYVSLDYFDDPVEQYLVNPHINGMKLGPNDKRGNPTNNDYFMYTVISVSYKMRTTRKGLPKF